MAKRLKKVNVKITEPIIDYELKIKDEFQDLVDEIKEHTDRSYDNEQITNLHITVRDREMLPTAVYFSFSNKLNITVSIDVHEFPGAHFLYSYLIRSVVGKVTWRGN